MEWGGERKIIDFHILVNIFSFFFYLIFLYIHKSSSSQISTYIRQHTARARNTTIVLSRKRRKKNSKSKDVEGCENGWWISLALYLYKIQFFYDLYIHHLWKTIPFFCRRCRFSVFLFNFLFLMQINNALNKGYVYLCIIEIFDFFHLLRNELDLSAKHIVYSFVVHFISHCEGGPLNQTKYAADSTWWLLGNLGRAEQCWKY